MREKDGRAKKGCTLQLGDGSAGARDSVPVVGAAVAGSPIIVAGPAAAAGGVVQVHQNIAMAASRSACRGGNGARQVVAVQISACPTNN